ncbi:RNA polymerase sigma factor [Paenibacillus sp.]|uniref:RNA polymerase sigma factor n=1 Tax=Paenibacillus sp. TaxID=58172 RepID=UPI002811B5FB|nr:RNA polymerase sigma factor [Paenibacillus sp.]
MRPSFESLVAPHLSDLQRYCRSLTNSKWDADELYQETLLKAFLYVRANDAEQITKSFLFSGARLLWIDACRKRKTLGPIPVPDRAAADADYVEVRAIVEWLAEKLPERHLELWMLSRVFGYSLQEIADRTGDTVPAVKSSLHRIRKSIRACGKTETPRGRFREAPNLRVDRWVRAVLRMEPARAPAGTGK